MQEDAISLDTIFGSLADPTRRDIVARLSLGALSVSDVAKVYDMSLAAVSKHLKVLEQASLIRKQRSGKQRIVSLEPAVLAEATTYLEQYRHVWECDSISSRP